MEDTQSKYPGIKDLSQVKGVCYMDEQQEWSEAVSLSILVNQRHAYIEKQLTREALKIVSVF